MKAESSSNRFYSKKEIEKDKYDSFKLSNHLVSLMFSEPFYTRIYRSINKIESIDIQTAGVNIVDCNLNLFWNRGFLSSLENKKITGLLKHEALHIVFSHITSRKKDPHIVWNYATDLAINSTIPGEELPDGALIPGIEFKELSNKDKEELSSEDLARYGRMSKLIKSLPVNKSSEYYFNILNENDDVKDIIKNSTKIFGFDEHDLWGDISEDERDIAITKIEEILKNAVKECESKGWGTVPLSIKKELIKRFSKTIKWSTILKRFCGFAKSEERRSSIKRLNRKYMGIHPGIKKSYKPKIAVYIDESGSMHEDILSLLYAELENLSRQTDFFLYRFDAKVYDSSLFHWKKGKRMSLERKYSGGTCFKSVTKHAIKNKSKYDGYIIMTDGHAPKPSISHGIKRAWIITPNSDLSFNPDKADVVIKMNK